MTSERTKHLTCSFLPFPRLLCRIDYVCYELLHLSASRSFAADALLVPSEQLLDERGTQRVEVHEVYRDERAEVHEEYLDDEMTVKRATTRRARMTTNRLR